MNEETKVTAAPTLAEQMGIMYKEVDGLYFPVWDQSDLDEYAKLGKYGHRWMNMLMEHDRYLYNKYFCEGTLFRNAKMYEEHCWILHDIMEDRMKETKEYRGLSGFERYQKHMQFEAIVDEIINEDLYSTIDYNKRMRLVKAKEEIASKQEELQRMED